MPQALGLGRNEEAVYTALLSHPTASSQERVRQTGLGDSTSGSWPPRTTSTVPEWGGT